MARLFVLDAMGLAYRAYYAFVRRPLLNSKGENTSAIFGLAQLILKIRGEEKPDYWALAWDGPGPTFRHVRYPEYKATRKPMPADLRTQLTPIEEMAQALGLPVLEIPGTEADDVMATLAHRGAALGLEVVLVTGDKDMFQSVEDRVSVFSPQGRGEDWERIDAEGVRARWGVGPEHIRDVLALMGDTSDNIPGVPGVGEKTAVELMKDFGSLDELYRRLDEVKRPALRENLRGNRDLAFLSRELATVRQDLDLGLSWDALRCAPIRRERLLEFAKRYEIRRLESAASEQGVAEAEAGALSPARPPGRRGTAAEMEAPGVKLAAPTPGSTAPGPGRGDPAAAPVAPAAPAGGSPPELFAHGGPGPAPLPDAPPVLRPAPTHAAQSTLDLWGGGEPEVLDPSTWVPMLHEVRSRAIHGLALLPVAEGDPRVAPLLGLALAARDGTACYLPLAHAGGGNLGLEEVRGWLRPALADPTVPKVAHDLKRTLHLLAGAKLPCEGLAFDLRLGSFLLDPSRDHELAALAQDALGVALPPLEAPPARGRPRPPLAALAPAAIGEAAARQAAVLFALAEQLRAQLESREQWALYAQLEHPLIPVLADMEEAGVRLDGRVLAEMSGELAGRIGELEAALYALAGEPLNLQSGPQVAQVLFEKFRLRPGRRTKTGFSTDEGVLEELSGEHPFPKLLLEYRTLTKLRSTYLEALPAAVDPRDGRVHTRFDQTGAATGRLSSSNPNLQNIPMRTPQGRTIRRAFVAPAGGVLIGADYSQIELRVMAHLSGDPNLIAAFAGGADVHAETARRIFNVTGELDPELRGRAKIVNFGVMYGMGARSLSQQMGIGLPEAQEFIGHYFRLYARVREFLDATVESARRSGYVQTLLGRRRYLPGLNSTNGGERSFAERAAINTPIQGSAADLMKLAMIRAHRALRRIPGARLLLQVHDELLLECREGDAASVRELVRQEMEGCYALRVPLVVSVGTGASWFDVH